MNAADLFAMGQQQTQAQEEVNKGWACNCG